MASAAAWARPLGRANLAPIVRILLDYRPALVTRTGVGEYVHRLAEALVKVSVGRDAITLFASSWKDRLAADVIPGAAVADVRLPARLLTSLWRRFQTPSIEQLAGAGPWDIVQSSQPTLVPSRTGIRLTTVYDLDFLNHPERTQAEFTGRYAALARRDADKTDHVIAISAYTAGEVEARLGVPRSRITVCRPGRPAWPVRMAPPPASLAYFLFVGTLEPRKNVAGLLDAYGRLVARNPQAPPLVLVGRTVAESAPVLAQLDHHPFAGRVQHRGYIPEQERAALYAGATALILPSFFEGFGLPVLEAMTVGVPVIASDRGALPEVLGDAGLLVSPDDPEELATAMHRVATEPRLAATLGARGARRSLIFDWTSSATTLREIYEALTAARRGPGGRTPA
jgi:glycosyltransferase involved in cell wall biosynthesis